MNNALAILKNNDGSVLAAVILILALLTLIAFASIDRSNTEVITAGNEIAFKQNIFNAESAVVEEDVLVVLEGHVLRRDVQTPEQPVAHGHRR